MVPGITLLIIIVFVSIPLKNTDAHRICTVFTKTPFLNQHTAQYQTLAFHFHLYPMYPAREMLHAINDKLKTLTKNQTMAWGPTFDWSKLPIGMAISVL